MEYRFQYLRNSDGQPVGCVAIKTNVSDSGCQVEYQVSVLNPLDRFDRTLARSIAVERLKKRPIVIYPMLASNANMHQITSAVMHHLVGSLVPARARKSAKLWLQEHTGENRLRLAHGVYA